MFNILDIYLPGGVVDKEVVENRLMLSKKWNTLVEIADKRSLEL